MKKSFATLVVLALFMTGSSAFAKVVKKRDPVKESYIVVLKDNVAENFVATIAETLARTHKGQVQAVYENGLKGFSVRMKAADAELLSENSDVEWVEEDAHMYLSTTQTVGVESWGLDRMDQDTPRPLSSTYSYVKNGTGVRAYVVDTGIFAEHDEFLHGTGSTGTGTTRVEAGVSFVADSFSANHPCAVAGQWYTGTQEYAAGHGTSVASVLGGRRYGVAKEVTLTPVRVFACNGGANTTRFLDGLN